MRLILNIDTSVETASICLAKDGIVLDLSSNQTPKEHASWLHPAILELLGKQGFLLQDLHAVSVSIGPGSFTGLRVGLAAAKGFCFALHIPLLTLSTLKMTAFSVREEAPGMICPMIDARRMEVFTALYDKDLEEKMPPSAMVLDEMSFSTMLKEEQITFCGDGSKKLKSLISNDNAIFKCFSASASHMALLSDELYSGKKFSHLGNTEPFYLKEFHNFPLKPFK